MSGIADDFVEQVAIQVHSFHSDDDSSKWSKQPGKYRTQMRRDVRDALSALDRLGYAIEKRRNLAAKDAEIEKLKAVEIAAEAYVASVNGEPEKDCWDTEDGKEAPGAERFASDWAWKAYDETKWKAFEALAAALKGAAA